MDKAKKELYEEELQEVVGSGIPQPTGCPVLNSYLYMIQNKMGEDTMKRWVIKMKGACDFSYGKKHECGNCAYLEAWKRLNA